MTSGSEQGEGRDVCLESQQPLGKGKNCSSGLMMTELQPGPPDSESSEEEEEEESPRWYARPVKKLCEVVFFI